MFWPVTKSVGVYGHFSHIFIIYTTFAFIGSGDFFFNRIFFFINKKYFFLFLFENEATGDIYELGGNFNLVVSINFLKKTFILKKN